MRSQRRALTPAQRQQAANGVLTQLKQWRRFVRARSIAFYWANDGELELFPAIDASLQRKKICYLPVITQTGPIRMTFARYDRQSILRSNRFGIPEPSVAKSKRLSGKRMDIVLMPLVAFDKNGNRLGMGAGYYDRCFAFLNSRYHWRRPHLVGVAYDFQQQHSLSADPWDVTMDAIVTPSGIIEWVKKKL